MRFCNLKDRQSIDNYKSRPVCMDDFGGLTLKVFRKFGKKKWSTKNYKSRRGTR